MLFFKVDFPLLYKFRIHFCAFSPVVYEINNEDVDALMKNLQVKSSPVVNDGVVRLRGLPYSCNEKDIVDFFAGAWQLQRVWTEAVFPSAVLPFVPLRCFSLSGRSLGHVIFQSSSMTFV